MIFVRDKSQMCNNLLQFAHVYAWAREHNRKVMSMRFSYKYPYFMIRHTSLTNFPLYVIAKAFAAIKLLPTASFKHDDCDEKDLERMMLQHKHIVVSGWYVRFYELFLKYRDEICDLFTIDSEYTIPVDEKMSQWDGIKLGVHIRRGDYKEWKEGVYFYSDEVYVKYISAFATLFPDQTIDVFLASNDPNISGFVFQKMVDNPHVRIHQFSGNAVEDLYMLSVCDYLIGPPSTYSLVASMYKDVPLYRMDKAAIEAMELDSFRRFDYWFRRIV